MAAKKTLLLGLAINSNRANTSLALGKQASCPRQKRLLPYPSDERGVGKFAV